METKYTKCGRMLDSAADEAVRHSRINVAIDEYLDEHGDDAQFRVWERVWEDDAEIYCTSPNIVEPDSCSQIFVNYDGDMWIETDIYGDELGQPKQSI